MAGNYADIPNYRMAYDVDGSTGFFVDPNNIPSALTLANLQTLNDETNSQYAPVYSQPVTIYEGLIFPQNRDITALFVALGISFGGLTLDTETSTDTTNGFDGTWTRRVTASAYRGGGAIKPEYRTQITTGLSYTNVKAFRLRLTGTSGSNVTMATYSMHLYGVQNGTGTVDRLRLWHPTLDQELAAAYFDFAEQARGSVSTAKQFRVKNNSATLTANSPVLSIPTPLTDASPTLVGQFQFSTDGSTYTNTVTLSNLTAGSISPIVYCKNTCSATASLSLWSARVKAAATSWT